MMRPLLLVLCLIILVASSVHHETRTKLNQGDILFIGLKTDGDDGFALVTFVDLERETQIYFADSEWNGTRFGMDESAILWQSGPETVKAGSIITFDFLNSEPRVSSGLVRGKMALSQESDAVFAYLGTGPRVPLLFLAAVANDPQGFGTLTNTGLKEENAIVYPRGTYFAEYAGRRENLKREDAFRSVTLLSNYVYYTRKVNKSTKVLKHNSAFNKNKFSLR